ncbi:MAG TPA: MYXO-CTERM sorting domain-containing protein [Kofleriaceae bacterium]
MIPRTLLLSVFTLAPLAPLGIAHAAPPTFPADTSFHPLHCHGRRMFDVAADQPAGADPDRDLVGDSATPAGLRSADDTNLYLRIRLNQTPASGAGLQPFAWGMAFDLDNDLRNYELLITVDGISATAGNVSIYTNTAIDTANSPADRADLPAKATLAFADAARIVNTAGKFGNDPDTFIDLAIPWATLRPLGLDRGTHTHVWAGSSSVVNALDGDLACFGGRTGITLDGADPTATTGDPAMDPSGDGADDGTGPDPGDGVDPTTLRLEGGSGCQTGASGGLGLGLLLAAAALLRRRR